MCSRPIETGRTERNSRADAVCLSQDLKQYSVSLFNLTLEIPMHIAIDHLFIWKGFEAIIIIMTLDGRPTYKHFWLAMSASCPRLRVIEYWFYYKQFPTCDIDRWSG